MNGLVSGYGTDSDEDDSANPPAVIRTDNGTAKSTDKGILRSDYIIFSIGE